MKPLYRLTPHARLSRNPLFALEARRIRGSSSGSVLAQQGLVLLVAACVSLLLAWLVLTLRERAYAPYSSYDFAFVTLAASLLAALLLDYRCMTSTLGSISGEVAAGRWDVLRLTLLEPRQIVAAKRGVAQVRAWRLTMLIIGARLAVALMSLLGTILAAQRSSTFYSASQGRATTDLTVQTMILIASALYVVEPFWRMRAVTALGVAISARARSHTSSLLAAFGALVGFWLAQGVVVAALAFGMSFLIVPLGLIEYSVNNELIVCAPLLFVGVMIAAVYGFYTSLQAWSIRRAERWAAQIG